MRNTVDDEGGSGVPKQSRWVQNIIMKEGVLCPNKGDIIVEL